MVAVSENSLGLLSYFLPRFSLLKKARGYYDEVEIRNKVNRCVNGCEFHTPSFTNVSKTTCVPKCYSQAAYIL